jgi:NADPH2:quinone reductase
MKAVIVREYTRYDKAEYGEIDEPRPERGEVLVDIAAAEVNYPDILYIEGKYQRKPQLPFSPGLAGAGRVSAIGDGVDTLSMGQRVLVLPEYGTYAEKVRAPASFCFPIPPSMPFSVAAALGLVYQTAYFALVERAKLQPGDTVLVLGATGGIGMATIQLAKALGADTVIAATRAGSRAHLARQNGADVVVDAAMSNLRDGMRDAVAEATNGRGADVVIDPVGGDISAAAMRALAWSGRLVVVGFASGVIPEIRANYLLVKNISVSGLQWTDYRSRQLDNVEAAQRTLFSLWSNGLLRPLISQTLPLERFAEALADLDRGNAAGKTILLTQFSDEQVQG